MTNLHHLLEKIWQACSGEAAWQTVADLSRCHRIQASPGHRQAAHLVQNQLGLVGLRAEILSYPADEQTIFWAYPSFQEWSCTEATLRLIAPPDKADTLADFQGCPVSVIQRSASFEGEVGVVLVEDGEKEEDYEGLDVAGKVVLTRGEIRRVWEQAVQQRGAAGILFDGMRLVAPVRPEGDLADVRQYTSFWWRIRRCALLWLCPDPPAGPDAAPPAERGRRACPRAGQGRQPPVRWCAGGRFRRHPR